MLLRATIFTLGVVVAIPLLGYAWEKTSGETSGASVSQFEISARAMCSSRIRDMLHNPSSVSWRGRAGWPIIEDGGNRYTVIAKYSAENAFGGTVQETRQCAVLNKDGRALVLGVD